MNINKKERSVTPGILLAGIGGALLIGLLIAPSAVANRSTDAFDVVVVSDDINKTVTSTQRAGDNSGHGNNTDGADSSNPGQGANSWADDGTDDEGAGGGAAPSK